MKACSKCGEVKPLDEFYERPTARDGRRGQCKACMRPLAAEKCRTYYRRHPERLRERDRVRNSFTRWGLTEAEREQLFEAQGRVCAICGTTEPGGNGWHLDHDHSCCSSQSSCGKCVRGILCALCNVGLGALGDSPERLEAAANYLRSG